MSKHAPGPWKCDEPKNWMGLDARVFISEPYGVVAQVPIEAWRPKSIGRANARLIAAAPTMLEALREVVDSAVTDADTCPICCNDVRKHSAGCSIEIAQAAIKLAEGGE